MSKTRLTEDQFLKDIAEHQMSVQLDQGVYRHLQFKKPARSDMWFDIVTWPGFLAYTGDMGAFTFSRLTDMFMFFRGKVEGPLQINLPYWGEKLEAVDRNGRTGGYKEFSPESMRANVDERVAEFITDYEVAEDLANELRDAVADEVHGVLDDGEHAVREAVRDFSLAVGDKQFEFSDAWEWPCEEYSFRFVWCCYALSWAIRQYDLSKAPQPAQAEVL